MKKYFFLAWILFLAEFNQVHAQDNTDLFKYWQYYSDIESSLYKHFCSVAFKQLDERKSEIDKLKTRSDWLERQTATRKQLSEIIGDFPKKTPLNPQITGVLKKDGYRIEKIIYESIPGYYVTGAMYIPDGIKDESPAIFYACGHSYDGFRVGIYQHIIINLVKKGFVVFTIDPMGQGERCEYWDIENNKLKYTPDHEHSYAGAQCMISGYSLAKYFIWDVIRGIDYMTTRKEIDPKRIGMTGRSGGGNITAYVSALDDRILAAAPEGYITNYEQLYRSRGPQCAEQNLYQMINKGLDHADFIEARAPKPTMIISTTRDFFSIQGARDSYEEAKNMYVALGVGENLTRVEDDDKHTSTKKNREAMYAFFQKQLNNPGDSKDMDVKLSDSIELVITKTGQVVSSFEAKSIFSMNKAIVDEQIKKLEISRADPITHLKKIPEVAAKLSGFKYPEKFGKPVFSGRYVDSDYLLEKYLIPGSGDYVLPAILLKPTGPSKKEILLMIDSKGMEHAINKDSLAHDLVKKGYAVLLFDLPGIGSMGPGYLKGDSYIEGVSYNQWFAASLTGKSFVGLRAEDILRVVYFAKNDLKEFTEISAISIGPIGGELLHAAVFEPEIKRVGLINPLLSYADMATTRLYKPEYIPYIVAGAIEEYDLPDLLAFLNNRKLLVIDPVNADGKKSTKKKLDKTYAFPKKVFNLSKNGNRFDLYLGGNKNEMLGQLLDWLQ